MPQRMPSLRAPTKAERVRGLPTSKEEAIRLGLTRFVGKDGQERVIRNYGSERRPSGSVELAASRKVNKGGTGRRQQAEAAATPPGADRIAYGRARQKATSANLEAHHMTPVFLTGNAVLDMTVERATEYFRRFQEAGVYLGNQAQNIMGLSPEQHREVHRQGSRVQAKLKSMGPSRSVQFSRGVATFNAGFSSPYSINETHPLGGNLVDVGPIDAPPIRTP